MINNLPQKSLLVLTNFLVLIASIYCLVENQAGNRNVKDFIFPKEISFANKNLRRSDRVLVKPSINSESPEKITSIQHYSATKDNFNIEVSISYLVNTRGNIYQLIDTQTNIAETILNQRQIKKHDSIGFYSIFHDKNHAYLSTCLNSQGKTTVTDQQFSANLNQVKITPTLLGKWLLGKASIRDRRCIWLHLSIPIESDINSSYSILESIWIDLVKWWIPNFPEL